MRASKAPITFRISFKRSNGSVEERALKLLRKFYWIDSFYFPDWQKFEGNITVQSPNEKVVLIHVSKKWAAKVFSYLQILKEISNIEFEFNKSSVPFFLEILFEKKILQKRHSSYGQYISIKKL